MDALDKLCPGQLYLVIAPRSHGKDLMSTCIAHLALAGPVNVLDGGNVFDAYCVARLIRLQTHELSAVMDRVVIRRAFTCYQMTALLAVVSTGGYGEPVVVLDMLSTFADENVPSKERMRLFQQNLSKLQDLAHKSLTLVGVTPTANPDCQGYLARLVEAAGQFWRFEPYLEPVQPRLL